MKIALIHFSAAPVVGGVERVMDEHARLFKANGHEVSVLCLHGGGGEAALLPAGESAEAHAAALRPVLGEQEIVFVHNVMTMPFHPGLTQALATVAGELPRVRFVAWVHDVAACNPDYPDVPAILRKAHPRFEYVAVSPLRAREFAQVTGGQVERCRVVPNGIDPARVLGLPPAVADLARSRDLLDGRLVLLHPARLLRRKRIETSLGIACAFAARREPATVLVTAAIDPHGRGSRAYREELRARFGSDGGHLFVGEHLVVGDPELAGLYQLADALLFPSRSEGFGLPLLEAAMHRLPVFCSDIEPLRDLSAGNVTFLPDGAEAPRLATLIADTLGASAAFGARKRVLRDYGWPSIYRRHLAPLLAGSA
jgi:glycosyltransferase involved in cell wall biosynthesis